MKKRRIKINMEGFPSWFEHLSPRARGELFRKVVLEMFGDGEEGLRKAIYLLEKKRQLNDETDDEDDLDW
ncbi:MAG: hypothetical protein Q9M37_05945 [Desulfonauticus sp.]|nr:hypothetical protein [Desulfonauticus sp.]